jgi:hypothetical protein
VFNLVLNTEFWHCIQARRIWKVCLADAFVFLVGTC